MEIDGQNEEDAYDAFISYSRKDQEFARKLETALEQYTPPKDLPLPHRRLKIFRDEVDFTGVDYQPSLEKHLRASVRLIVVCSPHARRSSYVDEEIRRFLQLKPSTHIVPVLLAGVPNNEAHGDDDDKAFPEALCDALPTPLAADFRRFNPRRDNVRKGGFENAWYTTLANLYGIGRAQLEQRDRKRQRKTRALVAAGSMAVVVALAVALGMTQVYSMRAAEERRIARQHDYIGAMELAHQALQHRDYTRAVDVLNAYLPQPGQDDVRNFLWYYLWGATHEESSTVGNLGASNMVSFPSGGQSIASVADGVVHVLNVQSGTITTISSEETAAATSTAVSPDGRLLAIGSGDGRVRVWNVATRQTVSHVLYLGGAPVSALGFSLDGRMLAGGAGVFGTMTECPVKLWDIGSGGELATQQRHRRSVRSIAFSRNNRFFATGGDDGTVRIWRVEKGQPSMALPAGSQVTSIAFSPDSALLAVGGFGTDVTLWNVESGKVFSSFLSGDSYVTSLAFAPDGATLVGGGARPVVKLWKLPDGDQLEGLTGHSTSVRAVAFSGDGQSIAAVANDGAVKTWDFPKRRRASVSEIDAGDVRSLALSSDGRFVAAGGFGLVKMIDLIAGREVATFPSDGNVLSVAFSPDGRWLAVSTAPGVIDLWSLEQRQRTAFLLPHGSSVGAVIFSPDGRQLVAGDGMNVRVWDVQGRQETANLEGHAGSVRSVAVSGNGDLIASGSLDGTVKLWSMAGKRELATLKGHQGDVWSAAFSPDGRYVASGSDDMTVRIWDVAAKREIGILRGHRSPVRAVAFSSDGLLASGSGTDNFDAEYTLKLWDVTTLREVTTLDRQKSPITAVAFAARGRSLVAATKDGRIRAWVGTTDQELKSNIGRAF